MTKVSIPELAVAVKLADGEPGVTVAAITAVLEIALRGKLGLAAMGALGISVDLGNGYSLLCKTQKVSGPDIFTVTVGGKHEVV
jgi:hypothetical protein